MHTIDIKSISIVYLFLNSYNKFIQSYSAWSYIKISFQRFLFHNLLQLSMSILVCLLFFFPRNDQFSEMTNFILRKNYFLYLQ